MPSKYYTEEDTCEICDGPVVLYLKQECTAAGAWLTPSIERIRCLNGCEGRGVLFGICAEFRETRGAQAGQ
ncbi:hypothetical protein B2J96_13760 [Mycobacterium shigaense]|nr:hypothetical protein B2J96_13760 [Mycobacterium shigaense]